MSAYVKLHEIFELGHREQVEEIDQYVRRNVIEFLKLSLYHPLQKHHSSYVSLSEAFWLWSICRDLMPKFVVESGTHHGYSAWWLMRGRDAQVVDGKTVKLITIDPDQSQVRSEVARELSVNWEHQTLDFSEQCFQGAQGLVFFDDHVDQGKRLREAADKGFRHLLFHDVYPGAGAHQSLWSCGVGDALVHQFEVIRSLVEFTEPSRSGHSWLTYVRLP